MEKLKLKFIERASKEWVLMWEQLKKTKEYISSDNAERWQYTCSYSVDGVLMHEFRNREHDKDGKRKYIKITSSNNISTTS